MVVCLADIPNLPAACMQKPIYSHVISTALSTGFVTNCLHLFVFAAEIFSCLIEFETLENTTLKTRLPSNDFTSISLSVIIRFLNLSVFLPLPLVLYFFKVIYCVDAV